MSFEPSQHTGTIVTVKGTAYDARAGAIVELEDRTPIYVAGLSEWETGWVGKAVAVTGLLRERAAKTPAVPPGGAQVHGLSGGTFALENATWELDA